MWTIFYLHTTTLVSQSLIKLMHPLIVIECFLISLLDLSENLATGSVTRMESDQKQEFVKAIGNLRANGGGDCPELAFKGMMDAIAEG